MSDLARDTIEDAFYPWNMIATQGIFGIGISISADIVPAVFVNEIDVEVSFFRKAGDNLIIFSILRLIFNGAFF